MLNVATVFVSQAEAKMRLAAILKSVLKTISLAALVLWCAAVVPEAKAVALNIVSVDGQVNHVNEHYEYRYTLTNNLIGMTEENLSIIVGEGDLIDQFWIPFFDNVDTTPGLIIGGVVTDVGVLYPDGWMAEFGRAQAVGWVYDPALDPAVNDSHPYTLDPSQFVNTPYALHFYVPEEYIGEPEDDPRIGPGENGLFGFASAFPPGEGPVQVGLSDGYLIIDPPFALSPGVVPEPATVALVALSTIAGFGYLRRRRS